MATTTLGSAIERRATWDARAAALLKYVRSCRNAEKRAYAEHYAAYLLGMSAEPDTQAYVLSYMGAQSVRMSATKIMNEQAQ